MREEITDTHDLLVRWGRAFRQCRVAKEELEHVSEAIATAPDAYHDAIVSRYVHRNSTTRAMQMYKITEAKYRDDLNRALNWVAGYLKAKNVSRVTRGNG